MSTYERDPAARSACLNHYGTRCQVCGLDFGETYGELGQGFIHVHHITPLSHVRESHVVDPTKDLVPVCPNCHAMLHIRDGEPLSVESLRDILAAGSNNLSKSKPLGSA
nr:HNH endonuclease [Pseudoxanthomonas sp. LH2527]